MDTIWLTLAPFLVFVVYLAYVHYLSLRRVMCPDCGDQLPMFYSPFKKTRRMWLAGGYLCPRCGCETDMAGRKVTADTPPAPFQTLQWALLAVLLLVGVGLAAGGTLIRSAVPAVAVAAPPVVELPQQAPAAPVD